MNEDMMQRLIAVATDLRPEMYNAQDCSITFSFDVRGTTVSLIVNDGLGGSNSTSRRIPYVKVPTSPV